MTESTQAKQEPTVSKSDYERIRDEAYNSTADQRAEIYEKNAPSIRIAVLRDREIERQVLPAYGRFKHKMEEKGWYSNGIQLGRDVTLTGVAIWAVYKVGMLAKNYFFPA